jgi:predicted RNA-binding Zn ribbon-like protein
MAKRKTRRKKKTRQPELVRRDGALCAVFVNTATGARRPVETYAELLAWGEKNGALTTAEAARLRRGAAARPADAEAVARRAQELRALVERVLSALAAHRMPAAADLEALSAELAAPLSARRLVYADGGFRLAWDEAGDGDLDRMLWAVLVSVADVLCSDDHLHVRRCDGRDCELLFVDRTPGRHRRWCSRKRCGDRARALKRYHREVKPRRRQRKKAEGRGATPVAGGGEDP